MSRRVLSGAALACALSASPLTNVHAADCCPIVELRQYTLYPGKRDELIALFEEHFIESQEAAGMRIAATFRDLGDQKRFVWVRGFADMRARHEALSAFYYGPVWQAWRKQANAMLEDKGLWPAPEGAGGGPALGSHAGCPGWAHGAWAGDAEASADGAFSGALTAQLSVCAAAASNSCARFRLAVSIRIGERHDAVEHPWSNHDAERQTLHLP